MSAGVEAKDGRVSGKASQPNETEGMFPSGFDVRFDVALLAAGESLPATKKPGPAANVKPSVTGVFKGNGKEAKLAYVSARSARALSDKAGMVLVFTEKDHSKDTKPDFNAAFGKFGSALIISLFEDAAVGCQVVHNAHKKQGFGSTGQIKTVNFKFDRSKVENWLPMARSIRSARPGRSTSSLSRRWERFQKSFRFPDSKKPEEKTTNKKKQTTDDTSDDDSEKPASQPAKDQLNVKDLAVTKDATDVEYKGAVEHVVFKSKSNPKAVCAELTASLKAQGWTNDGSDLITPASSILKRKRGEAALTIFVKPEGGESGADIHRRPRLGRKIRL